MDVPSYDCDSDLSSRRSNVTSGTSPIVDVCKDEKRTSHAMLVWGHKKDRYGAVQLYVKNSWGDGMWAEASGWNKTWGGNCTLPAEYVNKFALDAMVASEKTKWAAPWTCATYQHCDDGQDKAPWVNKAGFPVSFYFDCELKRHAGMIGEGELNTIVHPNKATFGSEQSVKILWKEGFSGPVYVDLSDVGGAE